MVTLKKTKEKSKVITTTVPLKIYSKIKRNKDLSFAHLIRLGYNTYSNNIGVLDRLKILENKVAHLEKSKKPNFEHLTDKT